MRNLLLLLALCSGAYQTWQHFTQAAAERNAEFHGSGLPPGRPKEGLRPLGGQRTR